jgi:methanogenic corrinoid protein MtbC1
VRPVALPLCLAAYNNAIIDTDREKAISVICDALSRGLKAEDALFKVVIPSIEMMMHSVSSSAEISMAQNFMASQIASEATDLLIEQFKAKPGAAGCMVIGTAYGDFHGLGKKIVGGCIKAYTIKVVDLGLSISAGTFVDKALEHNAQVIAISSMMIHTALGEDGCLAVRNILKSRGLENKIKIIVGGAPYRFNPELYRIVKADAWSPTGIEAGKVVVKLIEAVKNL